MKATKISFSKTVESIMLGASIWTKIGIEGELEPNDTIESAIEDAKVTIEKAHEKDDWYKKLKKRAEEMGNDINFKKD